jgi:sec-independent protein translocase protein TatA
MNLGMPEIIIIAIVVLILFGGKKLPEFMRGVGKGVHDFKKGLDGVEEEIKKDINTDPVDTPKQDSEQNEKDKTEDAH